MTYCFVLRNNNAGELITDSLNMPGCCAIEILWPRSPEHSS